MAAADLLPDERVYGELALGRPLLPRELKREHVATHAVLGAAFRKKNNLQVLGGGTHAVLVAGSLVSVIGALRPRRAAATPRGRHRPRAVAGCAGDAFGRCPGRGAGRSAPGRLSDPANGRARRPLARCDTAAPGRPRPQAAQPRH